MKKILSLLLALALVFSIAGCQVSVNTPTTVPESTAPETTVADVIIEDVTEPETTEPEVTEPETTLPPQTDPPKTEPVETRPLQTDPPVDHTQETEPATEPVTEPETTLPPQTDPPQTDPPQTDPPAPYLDPNGSYTTKDDVALYIYLYGRLPNNFITKQQAENYSGELCDYGLCIGGNRFYNREGLLPQGYTYYECDIGTLYSTSRGAKRLVFTYSGLIYYTSDHYKSFTLLYGNP